MSGFTMRTLLTSVAVVAVFSLALAEDVKKEATSDEGFLPLFNGKDLKGWKVYLGKSKDDISKTFHVEEGVLIVSGTPTGYCYT